MVEQKDQRAGLTYANVAPSWKQRLTGSLLGQLQLSTYAAVLLGFTAATSAGLWLNERNTTAGGGWQNFRAGSEALAFCLVAHGGEGDDAIRRELQDHSSVRTQTLGGETRWNSAQPRALALCHCPQGLLQTAMDANGHAHFREKTHVIEVNGRDYLTLLDRKMGSGATGSGAARRSPGLDRSQAEFLDWMIVIWGSCLGSLRCFWSPCWCAGSPNPCRSLSVRSSELTADGLNIGGTAGAERA